MYTDNRDAYRKSFYDAWQKHQSQLPVTAVESQMVEVVSLHPEYHGLIENLDRCIKEEYELEENPFFHLSLHITLLEQIRLNQPSGITETYHKLMSSSADKHAIIHQMMNCLAQTLWQAHQTGQPPDEAQYLQKLQGLHSDVA